MSAIFDRIANWVDGGSTAKGRFLWVMDAKTQEITWKSRKVYSPWQRKETGRLQKIFGTMNAQMPSSLVAQDNKQFANLVALHGRISASFQRFTEAHRSFFGKIYLYFFAYSIKTVYNSLIDKLDNVIADSIAMIDPTTCSPKDFETLAEAIKRIHVHPKKLSIDWNALTLDQFKAAIELEKHANPITLSVLDKEKTTFLLNLRDDQINRFEPDDIEQNSANIKPHFFRYLNSSHVASLHLSMLSVDQLVQLPIYLINFRQLFAIDLASFTKNDIAKILKHNPSFLGMFSPATVAANLSKIDPSYYPELVREQVQEIDFGTLTDAQKNEFPIDFQVLMKNYPQMHDIPRFDWEDVFKAFFGNSYHRGSNREYYDPFNAFNFGFGSDYGQRFFNSFEGAESQINEKFQQYQTNLQSAITIIQKNLPSNPDPNYQKLRNKCLNNGKELKKNPELVFVDEVKAFIPDDLKKYYRKAALFCHPDKNKDNQEEAAALFTLINDAYNYLLKE